MGNNNTSIYTGSRSLNILLSAILLFLSAFGTAEAQYVTMSGGQFKLNGEDFYPVVMNYRVDLVYYGNSYFLSSEAHNNITHNYECNNNTSCCEQLKEELDYIAGMGFNTVRIVGLRPDYSQTNGLFFNFHLQTNASHVIHIGVDPSDPSDEGMAIVFPFYDKLLEIADNAGLKVILLLKGDDTELNQTEVDLRSEFIEALSSHLASSPHASALFAYDLINEPCYHIRPQKTKAEACKITSTWYDIIKTNDPKHFVTIGACGTKDVFSFDPTILKLDFISLHYYSKFKSFEDRTLPSVQQANRIRNVNNFFWLQQVSVIPWIVGETGFTASRDHSISEGLDGTLTDMGDFVSQSLKAVCNCGGSGYSWWIYQDADKPVSNFKSNFYGLLERHYAPSPEAEKQPAVDIFRHYTPLRTGNCPVDYSPTYDANKVYYNPYLYPPNPDKEVSATVTDQYGNPIKNAVVEVVVYMGKKLIQLTDTTDTIVDAYDYYTTFTDKNGFFKAIPYQYGIDYNIEQNANTPLICKIKVSAPYSSVFNPIQNNNNGPNIPQIIQLERIGANNYDVNVNNETISTGQSRTYYGRNSLTVSNTEVEPGGNAEFKSAREVRLLPGFHAKAGSNTHIFISPEQPDCNEYNFNNAKSKQNK